MDIILVISLILLLYGIAGVLGFGVISKKYRGYDWTKSYIRFRGLIWMMMGIPWLIIDRAFVYYSVTMSTDPFCLIMLASAIPSCVFSFVFERKFKTKLKNAVDKSL